MKHEWLTHTAQSERHRSRVDVAVPPWDPPVVEIGRRRALQPEDEADRDGGGHQAAHGDPDCYLVPCLADETQKEEAQGPLGHSHADDGKRLPNGLEENGADEVLDVSDVGHVLTESIMCRDGCRGRVADKENLERGGTVSKHLDASGRV